MAIHDRYTGSGYSRYAHAQGDVPQILTNFNFGNSLSITKSPNEIRCQNFPVYGTVLVYCTVLERCISQYLRLVTIVLNPRDAFSNKLVTGICINKCCNTYKLPSVTTVNVNTANRNGVRSTESVAPHQIFDRINVLQQNIIIHISCP